MKKFRSKKNRVTIDGVEYEKRVDKAPRFGKPHERTILTETKGTLFVSSLDNSNEGSSTVTRTALTPFNEKVLTELLLSIVLPEKRKESELYRYTLLRYEGRKMLPVPAVYNDKEALEPEKRISAAKQIMCFISKVIDLETPRELYRDDTRNVLVTVTHDGIEVMCTTRGGASVTRLHDKETGIPAYHLRTLEEVA